MEITEKIVRNILVITNWKSEPKVLADDKIEVSYDPEKKLPIIKVK